MPIERVPEAYRLAAGAEQETQLILKQQITLSFEADLSDEIFSP